MLGKAEIEKIEGILNYLLDETSHEDLDTLFYMIGFCPQCKGLVEHHIHEPFASCRCGTGEDTGRPTFLQRIKHKQSGIYEL
jgi:hypothetical protein